MEELLDLLQKNNILIKLNDGKLSVKYPREVTLDDALLERIRANKPALIELLKSRNKFQSIPLAGPGPGFALSSSQQRLWVLSKFPGGSRAYNITSLHLVKGSLDAAKLEAQREALSDAGEVSAVSVDVTQEAAVTAAFAEAATRLGAVDVLVNNAGQAQAAPFARTDMALWQRMLDVNLTGVFLCTRAVLPAMLERSTGRIVNVVL